MKCGPIGSSIGCGLQGLKIRTYGDWGKILVDFGASVVTLAGSELYPAMERGVIDALEFSTPAIDRSMALWEVADYLHYPGIHSPGVLGGALFVNQARWNELPEDLKYIVTAAAEYTCRKGYATDKYNSGEAIEYYKSQGVEMVRFPDDLMAQIVSKCDAMWAGYAKEDAFFSEVWESQKAFVDRWAQSLMVEPSVQSIRAMS
jgi:TRAP-type mannitol/chloroaromatic compound transport system substrate-binding protein